MRRHMSRIALILAVLMLQFLMPFEVMALDTPEQEEIADSIEQNEMLLTGHEDEVEFSPEVSALLGSLNDEEQGNSDPELLFELSDKRSENDAKHFLNSDRSFTAVKYPFAVHYQATEEGEYIDIDNRLIEKSLEEQMEEELLLSSALLGKEQTDIFPFFPASSPIKSAIAPDTGSRYMAAIEHDGHIISWNYEEVHEGLYLEVTDGLNEQEHESTDITEEPLSSGESDDAEIQEDPIGPDTEEGGMFVRAEPLTLIPEDEELPPEREAIRNVASGLAFRNAAEGLSLEYILSSDYMEESLILEDEGAAHSYHIVYDIGDLTAEQVSQNELAFLDYKGEVIFRISAPYMKDSNEQYSSDITLNIISEKDGKILVELTPDPDWLTDPSRTYPVKIDPFVYQFTKSFDEDAAALYTHSGYPYGTLVIGNDNNTNYTKAKSYVKFSLPSLTKGDMVIGGILEIRQYAGSYGYSHVNNPTLRVNAYEVTGSWTANQIISSTGYNNLPSNSSTVLDYQDITYPGSVAKYYDFDISRAVKKWYEGLSTNNGIMLRAEDESAWALACFIASDNTAYPAYRPLLFVQYLNNRGLESYWTYHEVGLGDSGALYVNDYTGNPVIIIPIASTPGGNAPASLSLVYNGYMNGERADEFTNPGYGFRFNVQERITIISSSGGELMQKLYNLGYRYIYTDSDGTQHYFQEDTANTGTYIDEEGLKLKLTAHPGTTEYYRLTSDDGSYKTFVESGLLFKIYGKDGVGTITVSYNNGVISRVTDGAGRQIVVTTGSGGKVTSVTDPAGRVTSFTYDNDNKVSSIGYPDGTTLTLSYDGNKIQDIKAGNGSRTSLTYGSGTDQHINNRVIKVTEYDNSENGMSTSTEGQYLQMDYSELNETKFTDREGNTEVYQFDNSGRTISVKDATGGASLFKYYADHSGKKSNALKFSAYGEHFTENLLTNSSFENGLTGYNTTGTVSIETNNVYLGSKMGKITGAGSISRSILAYRSSGSWYTFSAYFKTEGVSNAKLRLEFINLRGTVIETYETLETDYAVTSTDRFMISGKAPQGTFRVKISLISTAGTVYTDCWQLEKSETLNHYNMMSNTDFSSDLTGWTGSNLESGDEITTIDGEKVVKITGNTHTSKYVYQSIYIGKQANKKNFLMSAMVKMESVPLTSGRHAGIGITAHYEDGTYETQYAEANPGVTSWQKVSSVFHFSSTKKISYIGAFVAYAGNANTCYFDKICLSSDQTGTAYALDENGNVITAADNAGQNTTYTYTNVGEVASASTHDNQNYTFTYDSQKKHFLKTAESNRSHIRFGFTYDTDWFLTETRVTGNDNKYIKENTGYSDDHAFVTSKTDAAGNTAYYDYGSDNYGLLRNVTDPEGNTVYYSYNQNNGRMTGMDQTITTNPEIRYTYNSRGNLTGISANGTYYYFTYDSFGRNLSTEADYLVLVENEYGDHDGDLLKTTYGNGDAKNYSYDSLGRLTSEYLTDSSDNEVYRNNYFYNAFGLLGKVEDGRNGRVYDYSYDLTDRPLKVTISDGSVIQTKYNTVNAVTSSSIRFRGEATSTQYEYSEIDRWPAKTTFDGAWEETYTYDSLGRVTEKRDYFDIGDVALYTYYTYVDPDPNDTNRTTGLIDTIVCEDGAGDEIYAGYRDYDYDANGRISQIKVKDSNGNIKTHGYAYDSKGQLVRHDDEVANRSYTYSYDSAGNILEKKHYPYTTGSLGYGTTSCMYEYSNNDWGDLLTGYGTLGLFDQHSVTYDDMGNPTSISSVSGNTTLTWEGRELTGWSKGNDTLTFSYDPDGYRASKTVNNVTTDYLVSGGKILAENNGTESIRYFYDPNGSIQAMKYGTTIYYYIKSAEGDILGLMNGTTGYVAATYTYDAWGVPTVTNIGNSNIGDINPIRYRGYYYDSETGLYYLGSRYYDPSLGRFISPDVFVSTGQGFTGYNVFAYCLNDPINRIDDGGNCSITVAAAFIGAVVGGLTQIATNYMLGNDWDDGLWGAMVGGAVYNVVAMYAGPINAGYASAAVEAFTNEAIPYILGKKKANIDNIDASVSNIILKTVGNGTIYSIGGKLAGISVTIDSQMVDRVISSQIRKGLIQRVWTQSATQGASIVVQKSCLSKCINPTRFMQLVA